MFVIYKTFLINSTDLRENKYILNNSWMFNTEAQIVNYHGKSLTKETVSTSSSSTDIHCHHHWIILGLIRLQELKLFVPIFSDIPGIFNPQTVQQLSHGLDDSGIGRNKRFSYSPKRPGWLWNPPSLLSNGYGSKAAESWNWPPCSVKVMNA